MPIPAHDTAVHDVRSMECAVYVGPCRDIRCGLPERVRLGLGQTVSEVGLRDALSLPRAWTSPVFAEHDCDPAHYQARVFQHNWPMPGGSGPLATQQKNEGVPTWLM